MESAAFDSTGTDDRDDLSIIERELKELVDQLSPDGPPLDENMLQEYVCGMLDQKDAEEVQRNVATYRSWYKRDLDLRCAITRYRNDHFLGQKRKNLSSGIAISTVEAAEAYRDTCGHRGKPDPAALAVLQSKLAMCAKGKGADAEHLDIVQTALMKFWKQRGRTTCGDFIESPLGYLMTIVENEAARIRNKRSREKTLIDVAQPGADPEFIPLEACEDKIRQLLKFLPADAQRFVQLSVEGLKKKQIAKKLGVSTKTVTRLCQKVKSICNRRISND